MLGWFCKVMESLDKKHPSLRRQCQKIILLLDIIVCQGKLMDIFIQNKWQRIKKKEALTDCIHHLLDSELRFCFLYQTGFSVD